jgi:hypothetical protein
VFPPQIKHNEGQDIKIGTMALPPDVDRGVNFIELIVATESNTKDIHHS